MTAGTFQPAAGSLNTRTHSEAVSGRIRSPSRRHLHRAHCGPDRHPSAGGRLAMAPLYKGALTPGGWTALVQTTTRG